MNNLTLDRYTMRIDPGMYMGTSVIMDSGGLVFGTVPMDRANLDAYTHRNMPLDKTECPYCGTYQGRERPNCTQCGGPLKREKS